ncbi:hypothetical protein N0V87_001733 [Didymella glomerata]|uniref:Uncharacterized protein n=1 Tax=Didymella glomerata TaxID=749621 RepID=A0A9W8X523_9PLEO|nr:hypothetical protein N0V87_001733 [Didymella glomerata]
MLSHTSFQQPGMSRLRSYHGESIELQQLLEPKNKRMGELEARLKVANKVTDLPLDPSALHLSADLADCTASSFQHELNDLNTTYSKMEITMKSLREERPNALDLQNRRGKLQSTLDAIRASASNVFTNVDRMEVDMLRDQVKELQKKLEGSDQGLQKAKQDLEDLQTTTAEDRRLLTEENQSFRQQLLTSNNKLAELEPLKASKLATDGEMLSLRHQRTVTDGKLEQLKRTLAPTRWKVLLFRLKMRLRDEATRILEALVGEEVEYLAWDTGYLPATHHLSSSRPSFIGA